MAGDLYKKGLFYPVAFFYGGREGYWGEKKIIFVGGAAVSKIGRKKKKKFLKGGYATVFIPEAHHHLEAFLGGRGLVYNCQVFLRGHFFPLFPFEKGGRHLIFIFKEKIPEKRRGF